MSPRGRASLAGLAVLILFCLPLLPEILGTRRLIFRDAQVTHWPWRRVAMDSLAAGRVPFVNVSASGGEPLLANPNAGLLYPTLLLEKVLAPAAAFNLHYLLHVLWAFFGARALARRLGLPGGPAFFSGVAFAFSGIMMSYGSAFANSGASASWLPWCAAATLDLVRARGAEKTLSAGAAAAVGFGLQLLAGEPALSLLTILFAAFLGVAEVFSTRRLAAAANLLAGGALAGLVAAALASPLLLPLFEVLPLTYRGRHLYSARAFGASPFAAWRMIEWFFPRFDADPGALGAGAHWQFAFHPGEIVYVWCVTFGVIPLAAVLIAAARRDFWTRRTVWLAAGALVSLLFAFGSSLPLFRILFSVPALRRLRYPIKFYLLTTLCVALLAGFAGERLRPQASRAGRRAGVILLALGLLFGGALLVSSEAEANAFDGAVSPLLSGLALPASELLPEIRRSLRGDAFFGLLATSVLAFVLFSKRPIRGQCHLVALATLLLAFPWALPLFVSADEKDLARAPVLAGALKGPGRVYVAPRLAESDSLATRRAHPELPPRLVKLARVQIEELLPLTGAAFGLRYIFETDPDGSYGYYNRLGSEAFAASAPEQESRLLRAYGARWVLDDPGGVHPFLRPVIGFEIAGRRLLLSEVLDPVAELRWAGRQYRRSSLSGALDLVRSESFLPESDIVLPGRSDQGPEGPEGRATLSAARILADGASVDVRVSVAGHLVFGRTSFPSWKARIDGRRVPVLVANARDLAVAVPAGDHHVEFEYDRAPFHRGVILQAAAFLLVLFVLASRWRRSRLVREASPA